MAFPDTCIRGIPNNSFVSDGVIGSDLFYFFKDRDSRDDGWVEQSINWKDDEMVIEFTLNQKKENGELQFKAGVAIIQRSELDRIRARYSSMLSYERQETAENPYHGNILLSQTGVVPRLMKLIASTIALYSEFIPRNTENP